MVSKYLYLTKGAILRNGQAEGTVQGMVKVFLKNPYGAQTPVRVNEVEGRTVANVEGSYKVDSLMSRQLKYFFGVDIPEDAYIKIQVSLWGKPGETLSKFKLNEGDLYMFPVRSVKLSSFSRNNGETGYQLNAQAFDFEPLRTKKADVADAPKTASKPVAKPTYAPPAQEEYSEEDFAAIDDSDDLPF